MGETLGDLVSTTGTATASDRGITSTSWDSDMVDIMRACSHDLRNASWDSDMQESLDLTVMTVAAGAAAAALKSGMDPASDSEDNMYHLLRSGRPPKNIYEANGIFACCCTQEAAVDE